MKRLTPLCLLLAGCILDRDIGRNDGPEDPSEGFTILVQGEKGAIDLVSDEESLYWLTTNGTVDRSVLYRVSKDGGTADELARFGKIAHSLRLDDEFVYATIFRPSSPEGEGEIARVAKRGGPVELIADALGSAFLVAVDETHAYFAFLEGTDRHAIARVPKGGGAPEVLVHDADPLTQLAVDQTHLYYTQADAGLVMRVAKAGGTPEQLAADLPGVGHLVLDDANLYFTSCRADGCGNYSQVNTISKDAGTHTVLAALGWGNGEISVAAGYVFVAGAFSGTVVAVPTAGGSPETILLDRPRPMAVTSDADAQRVFWVDFDNGDVGRIDFMVAEP